MVARPQGRATSQSPLANRTDTDGTEPRYSASTFYRLQITLLEWHVAALEAELEHQQRQHQAVVDRYERLLEQR